jgi:[ribosomal protein S18]-alanine N-acetyltransferase
MNRAAPSVDWQIRRLAGQAEAERCARMMASLQPWIKLQRDYGESLRALLDPQRESYVAYRGDLLEGFLILVMHGAFVGYIQTICVAPEARGRGLGTKLMQFAEERIFRESPNAFICSSSFNPRAQKLYERLGYEVVGELKEFIIPGHSEILLRKTIGPLRSFSPTSADKSSRSSS